MKEIVQNHITEWLQEEVIKEISYTPKVVTPILVVPKPHSDKLRILLTPKSELRVLEEACGQ